MTAYFTLMTVGIVVALASCFMIVRKAKKNAAEEEYNSEEARYARSRAATLEWYGANDVELNKSRSEPQ
jgi:MFS superfamily sulfate permease-like transporter